MLFSSFRFAKFAKCAKCIFFIKLRWPKNKSLYVHILLLLFFFSLAGMYFFCMFRLNAFLFCFVCLFLDAFLFFCFFKYSFMDFSPHPLPPSFFFKCSHECADHRASISTRQVWEGYGFPMFPHVGCGNASLCYR